MGHFPMKIPTHSAADLTKMLHSVRHLNKFSQWSNPFENHTSSEDKHMITSTGGICISNERANSNISYD